MLCDLVVLGKEIVLGDGRRLRIRPILPEDAEALVEIGRRSTPEDLRMRFFSSIRPELGTLSSLLCDFDRHEQIAVAAFDPNSAGGEDELLGGVRLIMAPDARGGEFSIMVRSDQKGRGLGRCLMQEMLGWAAAIGLSKVEGHILRENTAMLQLARACGAKTEPSDGDFCSVTVAIHLPILSPDAHGTALAT